MVSVGLWWKTVVFKGMKMLMRVLKWRIYRYAKVTADLKAQLAANRCHSYMFLKTSEVLFLDDLNEMLENVVAGSDVRAHTEVIKRSELINVQLWTSLILVASALNKGELAILHVQSKVE